MIAKRASVWLAGLLLLAAAPSAADRPKKKSVDAELLAAAVRISAGRETFRRDTFGSEAFWGGQLRLHEAVVQLSPRQLLGLGLKVDAQSLPRDVIAKLRNGQVDLDDPASTLLLLRANAAIGVKAFFDEGGRVTSIGIQCALCHSTVDDSVAPGVGRRRDGWANRDLDVGAIVAAAPDLSPFAELLGVDEDAVRTVLLAWGPGKFDAALALDGKGFRPDGKTAATLIPPAFGLSGVNLHTFTGWGSVTHWNALVANLEMHGQGTFYDPRLADSAKFPVAERAGFDDVRNDPDLVTPKLANLHFFQLSLEAPDPPAGSFDAAAAQRGAALFMGKADCARCHVPPLFTEPGWNMHSPSEVGVDDFQAKRSPDERYRTTPLAGLWTHEKGGFYHDGRFATLADVVRHYDGLLGLGLSDAEVADLVEYLRSL
jgi:mono/diheme cytochrome c family protein